MRFLALDSSSSVASVAFVGSRGEIHFRTATPHARSDSSALFGGLQDAVTSCGLPEAIVVGLGPGSYNGLRAGIAAARGLATALNLPLFAIASPFSLPGPQSGFWAAGDARGGHYWIALVENGTFLQEPQLLSPSETLKHRNTRPELPILGSAPLNGLEELSVATPDAARLVLLAKKTDPCSTTPEPLYLKPPHITAPRIAFRS